MILRRVAVAPGEGLIARFGGAVLFVTGVDNGSVIDELLKIVQTCCAGSPTSGRLLAQEVVRLLVDTPSENMPAFGALAPSDAGWVVVLHGGVRLHASGAAGEVQLSGLEATTWVDRILSEPFDAARLAPADAPHLSVPDRFNLEAGVVPGGAVEMFAQPAAASSPPGGGTGAARDASQTAPTEAVMPPAAPPAGSASATPSDSTARTAATTPAPAQTPPLPPPPAALPPPTSDFQSRVLRPGSTDVTPRDPLPVATPGAPVKPAEQAGPLVDGIMCERDHFNHPLAPFCATCGVSTVQRTRNIVQGVRPPLGVVVADDGTTYALNDEYVVGREPGVDPAVRDGRRRPLPLTDPERSVSRVHAEILLQGWDVLVVDRDSSNGTYVVRRGDREWTPLAPGRPHQLEPGTRIAFGRQVMTFDTHHQI